MPSQVLSDLSEVSRRLGALVRLGPFGPPFEWPTGERPAGQQAADELQAGPAAAVFDRTTSGRLAVLRTLLVMDDPVLVPKPFAYAPLGHRCAEVDELLDVAPGEGLRVLEDLADLGLLTREPANVVHICPSCAWCHLNFRETCPRCEAFDVRVERLLHHFHCGYTGLESEFSQGIELICPKCLRRLDQLGQDFERPHDTYVCNACASFFEEPTLEAQCLHCERISASDGIETVRVNRYRPSPLSIRAVEQGRLTGLDVSHIMYDVNVRLVTRDWLVMQSQRELIRLRRHGGAFSLVRLEFEVDGVLYPIFREWGTGPIRTLAGLLNDSLRPLDIVARLDSAQLGMLLVEADGVGAAAVEGRLMKDLAELEVTTHAGRPLKIRWRARTWADPKASDEGIEAFIDERRDRAEGAA